MAPPKPAAPSTPGGSASRIPVRNGRGRVPVASKGARIKLPRVGRLPTFSADPAPTNNNGDAMPQPISPIQPVAPEIVDLTIPLNSTAMDLDLDQDLSLSRSVYETPEELAGPRTRNQGARKQISPRCKSSIGIGTKKDASKALGEIKRYQSGGELLIPKAPFQRLIRGQTKKYANYRWGKDALEAVQEASEAYLVRIFLKAYACANHGKRVTLLPSDMKLAQLMEEDF